MSAEKPRIIQLPKYLDERGNLSLEGVSLCECSNPFYYCKKKVHKRYFSILSRNNGEI